MLEKLVTEGEKTRWEMLDVSLLTSQKEKRVAHRLNCLGSCYYFIKFALRRHRLYDPLHEYMAHYIERDHLKEVIEIPRDHFKSTIYSEGAPMWWALPFGVDDEQYMRALGYGDRWITWMRRSHAQDTRTLMISENKENINKLGSRIRHHYENNDLFLNLFPEIKPDSSCTWGASSLTHKRTKGSPNGEGTYDFLSVGSATQSRHYERVVEDDLVGRDAIDSDVVMQDTINYHRLLPGAFDSDPSNREHQNDEIVVGNRWSARDLNAWIRENEPGFHFVSHSALGGCCDMHTAGVPIFPLEWTKEKLESLIPRLGLYYFSCQYLNNPINPGVAMFDTSWLRYYTLEPLSEVDKRAKIVHEVVEGEVIKDKNPNDLKIFMVVDPNHSGNQGRCRHAITVVGVQRIINQGVQTTIPQRIYLLDCWAEACNYEKFVQTIFQKAEYWKLNKIWLETTAAQKYLKFYLDYRNKIEKRKLRIEPLKCDTSANAKAKRIEALNPYFAEGQVWIRRTAHQDFITEYGQYPNGRTMDILDTLGYQPQVWNSGVSTNSEVRDFIRRQVNNNPFDNVGQAGY